jgi:hypothetical protein
MKTIENNLYYIEQLEDKDFGNNILVIVKTYEGIGDIDNLERLLRESEFESTYDDIIVDLTAVNGVTASNRYIKIAYDDYYYRLDLQSDKIIQEDDYKKEFITMLKYKSCEYLKSNEKVLENSMLPNAQKFIIKSGKVI